MSYSNGNLPPQGTHFSDGVRTGPIFGATYTPAPNVFGVPSATTSPMDTSAPGIYNTPMTLVDIIPAPVKNNAIVTSITAAGASNLTLVQTTNINTTFISQLKTAATTYTNVLQLDCARNVTVTTAGSTTTATYITVFGLDQYLMPMSERILVPYVVAPGNGNPPYATTSTINGLKAFAYIYRVAISNATNGPIQVGVGNTFGLPFYMSDVQDGMVPLWNGRIDTNTSLQMSGYAVFMENGPLANMFLPNLPGMDINPGDLITLANVASTDVGVPNSVINGPKVVTSVTPVGNNLLVTMTFNSTFAGTGGQNAQGINPTLGVPVPISATIAHIDILGNPTVNFLMHPQISLGFVPGVRQVSSNSRTVVPLGQNPISTFGTGSIVYLNIPQISPSLALFAGDQIVLSGLSVTGSISTANLNGNRTIVSTANVAPNSSTTYPYYASPTNLYYNFWCAFTAGASSSGFAIGGSSFPYPNPGPIVILPNNRAFSTGDVRGTYTPTSLADGTKRLLINYYNTSGDSRNYNAAGSGDQYLISNPFFTFAPGSPNVNVYVPGHNLAQGDIVTFSGVVGPFDGITVANLTGQFAANIIDQNYFSVTTSGSAILGGQSGGGSTVSMSPASGTFYQKSISRYGNPQI